MTMYRLDSSHHHIHQIEISSNQLDGMVWHGNPDHGARRAHCMCVASAWEHLQAKPGPLVRKTLMNIYNPIHIPTERLGRASTYHPEPNRQKQIHQIESTTSPIEDMAYLALAQTTWPVSADMQVRNRGEGPAITSWVQVPPGLFNIHVSPTLVSLASRPPNI